MLGLPIEMYYPALAFLLWALVVSLIPKEQIKRLFWLSFLWGYLGSKAFVFLISEVFRLYAWKRAMPFKFLGAPHWLVLGWAFALMLYFYFMPETKERYAFPAYLFAFSLASAALDQIFHQIGLLEYIHWNPFYRFILAMAWLYGAARHYRYLQAKDALG